MRYENDSISASGKTHHRFLSDDIHFRKLIRILAGNTHKVLASFIRIKKAPLSERFFFYHFTRYQ